MTYDPTVLPAGLPVPEDDGAADHLEGRLVPPVFLETTQGELNLAAAAADLLVLYVYPRTGRPGMDATVVGLSAQTLEEQREAAERLDLPHAVAADPDLRLADALRLPTFDFEGRRLYKRLALVAEEGRIVKVFYPVFPPDENAAEVLAWLRGRLG